MFDKVKLKVLKNILEKAYPGRDFSVEKNGKHFIIFQMDTVGCKDFILEGKYTYNQVMELNNMTGYSAGFGFCKELGPIAFIGVPNSDCVQNSGYFYYDVQEYGDSFKEGQYYFEQYSDEDAEKIGNYTVYGMGDPRIFNNVVPVKKVDKYKDFRYKRKDEFREGFNSDVLEMDIKLGGTYGFYEARKFAYGSTGEFTGSSGEDVPIQFAIVGDNQPVGILGLWKHYEHSMFRDVWGNNEDEPESQPIRFISDDEAKKINQFKLYYFTPTHSFGRKQYVVEKKDRMFDKDFNFIMDDGTDYRLQELHLMKHNLEKEERLIKLLGYSLVGPDGSNRWLILDENQNQIGFIQCEQLPNANKKKEYAKIFGYHTFIDSNSIFLDYTRSINDKTGNYEFDIKRDNQENVHVDMNISNTMPSISIRSKEYGYMYLKVDYKNDLFINYIIKSYSFNNQEVVIYKNTVDKYNNNTYQIRYCKSDTGLSVKGSEGIVTQQIVEVKLDDNKLDLEKDIWNSGQLIMNDVDGTVLDSFRHFRLLINQIIPFNEEVFSVVFNDEIMKNLSIFFPEYEEELVEEAPQKKLTNSNN